MTLVDEKRRDSYSRTELQLVVLACCSLQAVHSFLMNYLSRFEFNISFLPSV